MNIFHTPFPEVFEPVFKEIDSFNYISIEIPQQEITWRWSNEDSIKWSDNSIMKS